MHIFLTTKSRNHHGKNRFAFFQLCPQSGHFIANIVGLGFGEGVYVKQSNVLPVKPDVPLSSNDSIQFLLKLKEI